MVLWGVIWGAFIGWLFAADWEELALIIGALLGALAGWMLRRSVRKEFARLHKQANLAAQARPASSASADPAQRATQAASNPSRHHAFEAEPDEQWDDAVDARGRNPAGDSWAATQTQRAGAGFESEPMQPGEAAPLPPLPPLPPALAVGRGEARPLTATVKTRPAEGLKPTRAAVPAAESPFERAVAAVRNWFTTGNVVARVGALMLFVGLAFLAKWAADNALFPPEARLAGIALVGIGLLVQGARMSGGSSVDQAQQASPQARPARERFDFGVLLQGLGVAVLYLAIFSAFKLYALLPAAWAFALMVAVCALSSVIAVLRNAQVLAFVGFAGAFATPVLLSDGTGNHVSLFSYYLLLNAAILGLAFVKPWRAVNLLGFFATFGVASAWGVLRYQFSNYASSQAFLLAFFAIYLAIGLLYALRHGAERQHKLDATLVFGLPVVILPLQVSLVGFAEYGAALSSLLGGALYIALALVLRRRAATTTQWLVQSYAAIGLLLVTLAVPLALSQQITAAVWALEGAAVYWLSRQQGRLWGRVLGVGLQVLAGLWMLHGMDERAALSIYAVDVLALRPFANTDCLSALFLVVGAWSISWWSRQEPLQWSEPKSLRQLVQQLSAPVSVALFVVGFAWAWYGLWSQLQPALWPSGYRELLLALRALVFIALVWGAQWAAHRYDWRGARLAAYALFPVVASQLVLATWELAWGWATLALWLLISAVYLALLYRIDRSPPMRYWRIVHTANVALAVMLLGRSLVELAGWAQLWRSDWYAVAGVVSAVLVLLLLCRAAWWQGKPQRWPLDRFRRDYLLHAGSAVALLVGLCTLATACLVRGNVQPLPYVPVLNPVDLTVLLGVAAIALWRLRIQRADWIAAEAFWKWRISWLAIAALGFVVVNTIWLRVAHHFFGVRWQASALADSFVVQAGYSVLWTVLALLAMLWARRLAQRLLWQIGAGLLAVTVVKMLLVDLANTGGGERIIAFIAVGALMVGVGYFAPMPAARKADSPATAATP